MRSKPPNAGSSRLQTETTPSVLALTRQKLKPARLTYSAKNLCAPGAYEIARIGEESEGRDLRLGLGSRNRHRSQGQLDKAGMPTRVVSVPSMELFEKQVQGLQGRSCSAPRKSASPSKPACAPAGTASSAPTATSSA